MKRSFAITLILFTWLVGASESMGQNRYRQPLTPVLPGAAPSPVDPMAVPRLKPTGRFNIHLKDGSTVIGKVSDKQPLKVKTIFGEATIPLNKIASVQFEGEAGKTKVLLRNNDRITGELTLESITVETEWAELEIGAKHIRMMASQELGSGQAVIRHAVTETLPDGTHRVRYIEEVVPAGPRSTPTTVYPGASPYSTPPAPASAVPEPTFHPARSDAR